MEINGTCSTFLIIMGNIQVHFLLLFYSTYQKRKGMQTYKSTSDVNRASSPKVKAKVLTF